MRRYPLLAAALLLAACQLQPAPETPAGAAAERVLATDRDRYAPGDTATLVLTNRFDHELGYNLCPAALDRRDAGRWAPAPEPEDRVCTLELRLLPPGERATYPFPLDPRLPPGEYRFRATVENFADGTRSEHESNAFSVGP